MAARVRGCVKKSDEMRVRRLRKRRTAGGTDERKIERIAEGGVGSRG